MCGLAGVFRAGGVEVGPVLAMTEALIHRGPDDVGLEVIRASGRPYAALGARRLSIVDVEGGHQPVSDPSGRFVVSMNGEIYNHQRLRREVAGGEPIFQSNGDTEVVSGLLAQCPLDQALPRLEGMFALAAVDTAERRLILARDRMGVKPLYWTKLPDGTIAWASELKGLRAHPAIQWALDVNSVNSYLLFEYIPTPGTIWAGVHKLEPGTWLEADARGVRTGRFWTPPVPAPGRDGHLGRWARSLYSSLQIAVHHRMSADVPVGYLLSGGLDSASVAAIAAKKSEDPIRTFSLAVDAPGFDEGPSARLAAASLGADHREARLGPGDLPGLLDEIADGLDEPLADSSLPATWRLMALVRESGLKCVLSGDGADESFAGYPTCVAHLLAPAAERAPGLVAALAKRLPVTHDGVTRDYMARRFADGLGLPWARRHQVWMGAWLPGELGVGPDDPVWGPVDAHARAADGTDPASRAMYLDQRL